MSGIGGIQVLEKIKQQFPSLRVIILTGYSSKDTAVEALRSRADDYLEKPLNIDIARATIARHLFKRQLQAYGSGVDGKIKRVKEYLQRNFHKKVTLNDAARAACLSPKYLSRIFKEHVKTGFNEYKLALRVSQAKQMLVKVDDTIARISDALGYQNPESFIRQFKKLTGLTPAAFRRRAHQK